MRWPLIVLTFPFSVLVFVLQSLFGWLPGLRIVTRRGLLKLGLIVAVPWLLLGQLAMLFDGYSASLSDDSAGPTIWRPARDGDPFVGLTVNACADGLDFGTDLGLGERPLGKPFAWMTACTATGGSWMLRAVGLSGLADAWFRLGGGVWEDWLVHGRLGVPYFLLGIGLYLQVVLLIPWLVAWLVFNVATRLRWQS